MAKFCGKFPAYWNHRDALHGVGEDAALRAAARLDPSRSEPEQIAYLAKSVENAFYDYNEKERARGGRPQGDPPQVVSYDASARLYEEVEGLGDESATEWPEITDEQLAAARGKLRPAEIAKGLAVKAAADSGEVHEAEIDVPYCEVCNKLLVGRSDSKTCSDSCRDVLNGRKRALPIDGAFTQSRAARLIKVANAMLEPRTPGETVDPKAARKRGKELLSRPKVIHARR